MAQLFANNAYGVLAGTVNGAATLLVLVSGQGARFPAPTNGDHFLATLVGLDANGAENAWEIVKCTGRATDQLSVVRAQESTIATTWSAGTRIELRWTKAGVDAKQNTLVSGTNIKTFGGQSILGSGDLPAPVGAVPIVGSIFAGFTSPDYTDSLGGKWLRLGFVIPINQTAVTALAPYGAVTYQHFTQRTMPVSTGWYSVTYGNGVFVAIAYSDTIAATSPDGITWTQRALPVSASWQSVTYGNGVFVAVAQSSAIAATSPDGITWTQRVLPASASWISVTYGGTSFVAVASGSTVAATSPNPTANQAMSWGTAATSGGLPQFVRYA